MFKSKEFGNVAVGRAKGDWISGAVLNESIQTRIKTEQDARVCILEDCGHVNVEINQILFFD
jgi:hypothetical protein